MIPADYRYNQIALQQVRPKCEPIISAFTGQTVAFTGVVSEAKKIGYEPEPLSTSAGILILNNNIGFLNGGNPGYTKLYLSSKIGDWIRIKSTDQSRVFDCYRQITAKYTDEYDHFQFDPVDSSIPADSYIGASCEVFLFEEQAVIDSQNIISPGSMIYLTSYETGETRKVELEKIQQGQRGIGEQFEIDTYLSDWVGHKIEALAFSGSDYAGNFVTWTGANLLSFDQKSGADPLGRTNSYITVTWQEIYFGSISEDGTPEKYNALNKMAPVFVKYRQYLNNQGTQYTDIELPLLFLSAKPVVKSNKIEWEAKDFVSFLTGTASFVFSKSAKKNNILKNILLNGRSSFLENQAVIGSIQATALNISIGENTVIPDYLIVDDSINSFIKDWASIHGRFLKFSQILAKTNAIQDGDETGITIGRDFQYGEPEIEMTPPVSKITIENTKCSLEDQKSYEYSNYTFLGSSGTDGYLLEYLLNEMAISNDNNANVLGKRAYKVVSVPSGTIPEKNANLIYVYPINQTKELQTISINRNGEGYEERNPYNIYGLNDTITQNRISAISSYFVGKSVVTTNIPAVVTIEPGDFLSIETNTRKNGMYEKRKCVVVETEIRYTGSIREKIVAHEVL